MARHVPDVARVPAVGAEVDEGEDVAPLTFSRRHGATSSHKGVKAWTDRCCVCLDLRPPSVPISGPLAPLWFAFPISPTRDDLTVNSPK